MHETNVLIRDSLAAAGRGLFTASFSAISAFHSMEDSPVWYTEHME